VSAIRPAAVAGSFYPGESAVLRRTVDELLRDTDEGAPAETAPKVLIVPHAGYVYSGPVAAAGFALLKACRKRIRRVVLLGPAHRVYVRGVAVPGVDAFATPLGPVQLDRALLAQLALHPRVVTSAAAHAAEHSLEVQLPFLQSVLDNFLLVPLVVGDIDAHQLATLLDPIWGDDETLVVVSSDLSHYHAYKAAQEIDRATVERIVALAPGLDHQQACGATPINAALEIAGRRGLRARVVSMCNSGDTAGDRDRVVGYCAVAFEVQNDGPH
jgi:hypothetical protein